MTLKFLPGCCEYRGEQRPVTLERLIWYIGAYFNNFTHRCIFIVKYIIAARDTKLLVSRSEDEKS